MTGELGKNILMLFERTLPFILHVRYMKATLIVCQFLYNRKLKLSFSIKVPKRNGKSNLFHLKTPIALNLITYLLAK